MKTILFFTLILLFFFLHNNYNKDKILYEQDAYTFTQKNLDELILMGEFIARSKFSKEDKKSLKAWAIEDFKSSPQTSLKFYNSININVIPHIIAKKTRTTYPTELYGDIRDIFQKNPDSSPHNFLAIIEKYNPPITELYLMRERKFNLLQQTFFTNQQNFNMIMNTQQQNNNLVIESIKDHSLRQSIAIEGGVILQEFDDYLLVKDTEGEEYKVKK